MKLKIKTIVLTAPLWPVLTYGLGVRIADQDSAATARGNAFAATADNASAVYYNPAGITQIQSQQFSVGAYGINLHDEFTDPTGAKTETKNKVAVVPQLFYAMSCPKYPVSFGLGFYSPYGLGLEWPDNPSFRALRGDIRYLTVNPVIAWKITDSLSIAAGPTFNYGDTDLRQTVLPAAVPAGGQLRFRGDDTAFGVNAGIMFRPHEKHSFGLTYFSATKMNFSGTATTEGVPPADTRNSASAEFQFPQHIVAGWSFRPTKDWNLEFNADWTDWDTLNSVTLNQSGGPSATLPFNWKSSWFYEFGVTRYLPNNWEVSAGYIFSENSVPEGNFNPLVPDSDRHIFSLGVGRKYEHFSWNLGYQLAWGPERTISASAPLVFPVAVGPGGPPFSGSANGRYSFVSHALAFNIRYLF